MTGRLMRRLLNSLLYFPAREILQTPAVPFTDVEFESQDGERLHGWWVPAQRAPIGHVLLCHGNAGNLGDRVPHVELLPELPGSYRAIMSSLLL